MKINELIEKNFIKNWAHSSQKYWQIAVFLFLGLVACILHFSKMPIPTENNHSLTRQSKSADTFIPAGYVLIPIDILNAAGLNNLIGDIGGTVDLYSATSNGRKGRLVGQKIKLLKAPLNPDLFAVLIPENESAKILENEGGFIAVIHNPKSELYASKFRSEKKISHNFPKEKIEIEYYDKELL